MSYDYVPDHRLIAGYAVALFDHVVALQDRFDGRPFTAAAVTATGGFPLDNRDQVEMLLGALDRIGVLTSPNAAGERFLPAARRGPRKRARRMVEALAATAAGYLT